MDLTGLIESRGVEPALLIKTLETMSERATSGVLVRLLIHSAAQELIQRARAALEDAREALADLEGRREALNEALDKREAEAIAAHAELQRISGIAARAGASASIALCDQRAAAADRLDEAQRSLSNMRGNRGAVLQQQVPAARQEVARLEALIRALQGIEAPDVSDLRAALQRALDDC